MRFISAVVHSGLGAAGKAIFEERSGSGNQNTTTDFTDFTDFSYPRNQ
jgi:hypothetical protein